MVIIGALIILMGIGFIVIPFIQVKYLKRSFSQDIQSVKELFTELEKKITEDHPTPPKSAFAIPPRQNNDSYKKPILPPEKERKPPPPANPIKTKRW